MSFGPILTSPRSIVGRQDLWWSRILDPNSNILAVGIDEIVTRYRNITLENIGLEEFRTEHPASNSRLVFEPGAMRNFLAAQSEAPEIIALRELSNQVRLGRKHLGYLFEMRDFQDVDPKVIYDIGACVLHWTKEAKRHVWPNARYILFEAMDEVEPIYLENEFRDYSLGVLSDVDGKEISFYQNALVPGGNSYYKENVEINPRAQTYFNETHKRIKRALTLDTVVTRRAFPRPDLIKMDVQGAELDVLKGAQQTLEHCKNLILELQRIQYNKGAPLRDEVIEFLASIGYRLMGDGPFCDAGADGDYHFVRT